MHVHDVLIIGAGPAGLAAAARLREHTPSATFTDDEHQRYHWIKKHGRKMNIKNYKTNQNSLFTPPSTPDTSDCGCDCEASSEDKAIDMLVLDADGADWMAKWNRLFKYFAIKHLRSPMFFHVDPADRDALLGYTLETNQETELIALPGCAGREVSKHKKKKKQKSRGRFVGRTPDVDERDRKDYFTPSTKLFDAHCQEVIRRYGLNQNILRQERVVDIDYDLPCNMNNAISDDLLAHGKSSENDKIFRVTTDQGVRYANVVILAVGPGNAPTIPSVSGLPSMSQHDGYTHAMHIKQFPPPRVVKRIEDQKFTNLLIVGGGLTSIQLADLAIKRGVSRVWLMMRGPLKVKYFDIELDWVGKFRNFNQAAFWSADTDEERFELIMQARNGGSITPRYRKILDTHVATGKLSLQTHTTLKNVVWDAGSMKWVSVAVSTGLPMPSMDYIVFATGIQTDIKSIPFLQTLQQKHPIPCIGGLPCINNDLMWNDEIPLFATGRLASLRLGPGAPNLIGARVGAERIAWNVEDVLKSLPGRKDPLVDDGSESLDGADDYLAYAGGRVNRFTSLHSAHDI